eukprot:296505-Pyramimonas_sp.AAC.1
MDSGCNAVAAVQGRRESDDRRSAMQRNCSDKSTMQRSGSKGGVNARGKRERGTVHFATRRRGETATRGGGGRDASQWRQT